MAPRLGKIWGGGKNSMNPLSPRPGHTHTHTKTQTHTHRGSRAAVPEVPTQSGPPGRIPGLRGLRTHTQIHTHPSSLNGIAAPVIVSWMATSVWLQVSCTCLGRGRIGWEEAEGGFCLGSGSGSQSIWKAAQARRAGVSRGRAPWGPQMGLRPPLGSVGLSHFLPL